MRVEKTKSKLKINLRREKKVEKELGGGCLYVKGNREREERNR